MDLSTAIDVIESAAGFTDPDTSVGEAWAVVLQRLSAAQTLQPVAVPEGREPAAVQEEVSDRELLQLMPEQFRADLSTVSRMAAYGAGTGVTPGLFRVSLNTGALDYARAVLARWGRPAAPPTPPAPAAEEAEELVAALRSTADGLESQAYPQTAAILTRAATLLRQLSAAQAPQPVAVSERLPGAEDCDEQGRCWVHQPHYACPESPAWELMLSKYASANYGATHWLPAHALPLPTTTPAGEEPTNA